jgi:PBP1b-binding outer membrane lipoprotein LpoB
MNKTESRDQMQSFQASMVSSQYQLQNNGDFIDTTAEAGLTLYNNNFETVIKHRQKPNEAQKHNLSTLSIENSP